MLAHLELARDSVDKQCVDRALRHTPETLVGEQITTHNLASLHSEIDSLYKAISLIPVDTEVPSDMLDAAIDFIEIDSGKAYKPGRKFTLRKTARIVKMGGGKSSRISVAKVRKAAQRVANKARKSIQRIKEKRVWVHTLKKTNAIKITGTKRGFFFFLERQGFLFSRRG